jgi:hypothetical protein
MNKKLLLKQDKEILLEKLMFIRNKKLEIISKITPTYYLKRSKEELVDEIMKEHKLFVSLKKGLGE